MCKKKDILNQPTVNLNARGYVTGLKSLARNAGLTWLAVEEFGQQGQLRPGGNMLQMLLQKQRKDLNWHGARKRS